MNSRSFEQFIFNSTLNAYSESANKALGLSYSKVACVVSVSLSVIYFTIKTFKAGCLARS